MKIVFPNTEQGLIWNPGNSRADLGMGLLVLSGSRIHGAYVRLEQVSIKGKVTKPGTLPAA
jgi:hypothetical protein